MRYALLAVSLLTHTPTSRVSASLWDDETLAADAKGLPDLIRIITGRFERNPRLYYEMRLARAAAEIKAQPNDLAAYDVAGVACDHLGRGDDAIAWMEQKNLQLAAMVKTGARTPEDVRDHFHRCLANLGTFWLHRWERGGGDSSRVDEAKMARDFIVKAITLYPHTHFERERYQLRMLEPLIVRPEYKSGRLPPLLDFDDPTNLTAAAVRAVAGLIVLGNEWESLDLFNTLAQTLEHDDRQSALAFLARLRCHELIDEGQRSHVPGAPPGAEALGRAIDPPANPDARDEPPAEKRLRDAYRSLRDEAEAWQDARTTFMTQRLDEGRQPNTDRDFWKGYREVDPPALAIPKIAAPGHESRERRPRRLQGLLIAGLTATGLLALMAWMSLRNTQRKRIAPVVRAKRGR